jgi:hypothetical protein
MFEIALPTIPTSRANNAREMGHPTSAVRAGKSRLSTSLASLRFGRDDRALLGFGRAERICVGAGFGPILVG